MPHAHSSRPPLALDLDQFDCWADCTLEGCCSPLLATEPVTTVLLVPPTTTASLLLKSLGLLTHNIRSLATDFLTHTFSKPKKPSWDIRLAMFISFFHQLTSHHHLGDLHIARALVVMPNMIPGNAIVITPMSFRVRSCKLRGVLSKMDAEETGRREIDGEWVAEKKVWNKWNDQMRMAKEEQKGERSAFDMGARARQQKKEASEEKIVLYLHGGAYYLMSAKTHRDITYRVSKVTGRRVFAINYRLAPETRFPGALLDAVYAFLYLTDPDGLAIDPSNIVVMGDSAGGGLALAMILYLRDHRMANVGCAVLFSPWVDLTFSSPSWETNPHFDYLPPRPEENNPLHPTKFYLGPDQYPQLATHPYVSPLFARSFENLPPLLIQHGDSENLSDEISELARRIAATETTHIQYECYEDMVHVFHAFNFLEPAKKAMESVGGFVKNVVPTVHKYQAQVSKLRLGNRSGAQAFVESAHLVPNSTPATARAHNRASFAPSFHHLSVPAANAAAQLRTSKSDPNLRKDFGTHHGHEGWGSSIALEITPWTMTAAV
ncbi:Alpha/Beta hydrolase protein [Endogone sp. FLAS-F59071]|nr:Alpha/Beta hydrolase protein [Endogone sp. FLAS-F59071]|eukprot:RUS22207.1 Alpha/Beta hydrolase protein [Endogone sp. FLAS-F59071]